jgi:hypothetical protein
VDEFLRSHRYVLREDESDRFFFNAVELEETNLVCITPDGENFGEDFRNAFKAW